MSFPAIRILIIEDTKSIALLLGAIFRQEGCIVDLAESVEIALEIYKAARNSPTKISLILADKCLPGKDGDTLLATLNGDADCPPIIVMTADASQDIRENCMRAGALAVFAKPFDTSRLKAFVLNPLRVRTGTASYMQAQSFDEQQAKLTADYLSFLGELIIELQRAIPLDNLSSQLHKVRGSAALYGLRDLSEKSRTLSKELKKAGVDAVPRVKRKFRIALQAACDAA